MIINRPVKVIIILGPTASGKSDLAVRLAEMVGREKLGGYEGAEIISADSRQVYKGLDLIAGKITHEEMRGIPHHGLDIAHPSERLAVTDWLKCAKRAIVEINAKNKLPIVCGGTGYYISALINGVDFPEAAGNLEIQKELEIKSAEELFLELERLDPKRAQNIDRYNKRRLVRAISIARELGTVPALSEIRSPYDVLKIGITMPDQALRERIRMRLVDRLEHGMVEEAERLLASGLSSERMDELGLECRYLAQFIQGKINREQLIDILATKIWQYARRQKTWWRKDKNVHWSGRDQSEDVTRIARNFLI